MVGLVIDDGWTIEATAEQFQVDAKTVRKWRDRYLAEGLDGLKDRSSRPRSCPWQTPAHVRDLVLELRRERRWGAAHIGHEVGLATSTVQKVLASAGVARLDRGDRATAEPVRRYERERPGELVHVDVKKLAASRPAEDGVTTAEATTATTGTLEPATATCIPPSMTAPGWSTRRSSTTNKPSPPPGSGVEPPPGSPLRASAWSES
jgi:transposase-like protein